MGNKKIKLFWWSEPRLMGKKKENYGDLISKYLVEKISGKEAVWVQPKKMPWYSLFKKNYLAAGSILAHANKHSIVWGSGINDQQHSVANADFRAVRGPRTRAFLMEKGLHCPEIYGDPAILLPEIFNPSVEKKYKLGVVPHYNDYTAIKKLYSQEEGVSVLDLLTEDVEMTTLQILECENIISSSLHGTIVAHAYGIPSLCVKFSDRVPGDGIKFIDYYESVGIKNYEMPTLFEKRTAEEILRLISKEVSLPDRAKLGQLINDLMEHFPLK